MVKNILNLSFLKRAFKFALQHKKRSFIALIILIAGIYFIFPKNGPKILTEKVEKKDILKTVSVTGDVGADNTANLTFQTPEILGWVGVKEGDSVVSGQAIASLNQSKLQASLRQAQQDFIAAKAASQQYYDDHTNKTESDAEKVQRTAIDAAQNKAYDQLLKVQYDIDHSTLFAPISGIVTRADAQTPGVNVNSLTTYTITDPSSLNFKMEVDEADIGQVFMEQKVNVSFDAYPNSTVTLTVDKIDFVSHKTSSGGNAFYVSAHIENNNDYRVGMSANADIIVSERKNVLGISSSSIFDENYVFVKKGNKFEKKKITIGLLSDTDAEIISGLSKGDYVALDPTSIPKNEVIN